MGARDDGIVDAHRAVEQRLGAGAVRREEREQERMEQFRRFHIFGLQNVYTRFYSGFRGADVVVRLVLGDLVAAVGHG